MKKILLAITGSIAAIKTYELIRSYQDKGFEVQCLITKGGAKFVSIPALEAISHFEVLGPNIFEKERKIPEKMPVMGDSERITDQIYKHIKISEKIQAIVIAPATANTISEIATGRADNFMIATILAAQCPIIIAPAMNSHMLNNPATQENIQKINQRKNHTILPTQSGELACGDHGYGKLLEIDDIVLHTERILTPKKYKNKTVLISLGGTHEPLDPIRYIGNYSSGKTGIGLAKFYWKHGADVTLVVGPTVYKKIPEIFQIFRIKTAQEMLDKMQKYKEQADIIVFAAAVADFQAKDYKQEKIKKSDKNSGKISIELQKNPDIAQTISQNKKSHQKFIGFALETGSLDDLYLSMKSKLKNKNLDIVLGNFAENIGSNDATYYILDKQNPEIYEISGNKEKLWEKIF